MVCDHLVRVGTLEAAELTKLLENIIRSVNIALVNELAMLTDRMGIDIWEVLDAASTKPYGFMRFEPGPTPDGPSRAHASRSSASATSQASATSASPPP
jgi:UDP-N-acetyl-D-glucosamine dehydrogenase